MPVDRRRESQRVELLTWPRTHHNERGAEVSAEDPFELLHRLVGDAVEDAVNRAAETVATAARVDHPYTDRSGALTASIEALPAVRTDGGAIGGVVAGEHYASFVEAQGYPFLGPALSASEARIEHDTEDVLEVALRRGAGD